MSMDRPHLACLRTIITPQNWSGTLHVRSLLDGRVRNDNVAEFAALAKHHLTEPASGHDGDMCWLVTETSQSRRAHRGGRAHHGESRRRAGAAQVRGARARRSGVERAGRAGRAGDSGQDRRDVHLPRPRDLRAVGRRPRVNWPPLPDVPDALRAAHTLGLGAPLAAAAPVRRPRLRHTARRTIETPAARSTCTCSTSRRPCRGTPPTSTPACPARGLHGEGYRGHVFWDELFVFPLLNLRVPELTRALLLYRYRRLPQARRSAHAIGAGGCPVPVAERQRRARGDPRAVLQPALAAVDGRQLAAAVPRQPGDRLQRLAVLPGHRATSTSWPPTAPSCWWRSPGSGPPSPNTTRPPTATTCAG